MMNPVVSMAKPAIGIGIFTNLLKFSLSDLVPTSAFQEALHLLKIILNTHDVSVVPDVSPLASMTEVSDYSVHRTL